MAESALAARGARQVWAAPGSTHDRLIRMLRLVLPAAIVVLLVLMAIAPLTVGRDISFVLSKDRVAVARERMRVSDAIYRGEDGKGQPFAIRAGSAVQVSSADPIVRMADLSARIALPEGPASIVAKTGRYDMTAERVLIDGAVRFETADGYRLDTRDVGVDLKTRRVASGGAVDGKMQLGTFRADRMTADLTSHVVVLEGRARLHIDQRQSRGRR
ncbi:LPS export ABC transporter periplasmic protein LptC [Sphingomonas solaris]|uniref:LPS export ABC transporter periplasmic protein LptC n=1 Tax=Alterirhizorhabdus solaris TaxID=2529389 RepID=A0A558QS77_9SPHN|nr:LPS export ABC transporter periplasmic protein LptC [Sphingomonas solaris]TVV69912.1 LPS export ABC transporter periplasmic protein LptC [Sphingomonas solaris]